MSFEQKKTAALDELRSQGVWRLNAVPPALAVLWWLGVEIRPPHYNPFWKNAVGYGLAFALCWGALMGVFFSRAANLAAHELTLSALMAGGLFGLFMAVYYTWSARRHRLSDWQALARSGHRD